MKWKYPLAAVIVVGAVAFVSLNGWAKARVKDAWTGLTGPSRHPAAVASGETEPPRPWDGTVTVEGDQQRALGLNVVEVEAQTKPLTLIISGSTAYDEETQSKIRPKFLSRVDKVHVRVGQHVEKDQSLIDLYSSDLAQAKGEYEEKKAIWDREKRQLVRAEEMFNAKPRAMAPKDYEEARRDEDVAHREFLKARDRLLIDYGLTEKQIDGIKDQAGERRAMMTLRSPVEGYVIQRDVVPGNYYDITNVLLVIAPLDQFWVWGNVYPSEANLVKVGQVWNIYCQTLGKTFPREVDVVTPQVDPVTKTIRIRTSIPNEDRQVKADLLVSGTLEIPPPPDSTAIPRVAMVTADGGNYVFVRRPGGADRFERRKIQIAREEHDRVVVLNGLKPGEEVVGRGSLILNQIYEDSSMAAIGTSL